MRQILAAACLAACMLGAPAAHAADSQLACAGEAHLTPDGTTAPLEVRITLAGGLGGPTGASYAWGRPEEPVPLALKGLLGETLQFHGMAPARDGSGVLVADIALNRDTLALTFRVRRLGAAAEDISFETTCRAA